MAAKCDANARRELWCVFLWDQSPSKPSGPRASETDGLPGTESLVYVDVQGILTAVQNILPGQAYQDFLDQGGENLQPITVVVAGSESDEQGSSSRFLVGIP